MSTNLIQKITGNPPAAPGSSTYELGWGYDSVSKTLRLDGHVVGGREVVETLAAAKTLVAADSGKTFILSHATEFAVTLPAIAAGLYFKFIVGNAPETASYTIVTPGGVNLISGLVLNSTGASSAAGCLNDGLGDTITIVDSQAVIGDTIELFSDGVNWYGYAYVNAAAAVTFTTAA